MQWPRGNLVVASPPYSVFKFNLAPMTSFHTSPPFQSHLLTHINAQVQTEAHKHCGIDSSAQKSPATIWDISTESLNFKTINLHKLGCYAWRSRAWCVHDCIKQLWVCFLCWYFPLAWWLLLHLPLQLKSHSNDMTWAFETTLVRPVKGRYMTHCRALVRLAQYSV